MSTPQPRATHSVLTTGSVPSQVTHLFRTRRVSEIRAYEAQIRSDAEEKSTALRDLLGTRYKDLLIAADEMISMKDASVIRVRDALVGFNASANALRERFLEKGHENKQTETVNDDLERRRSVHVVGSKLKHIVDSPEVLYANLESGEVYDAAVRYSLAHHNYQQVMNTTGLEGVANRFAELRWKQVHIFKDQILEAAEKRLQAAGHTFDEYARVFVSLMLLTENCDVLSILDGMLASRTGLMWNEQQATKQAEVATQMKRIATLVRETVSCIAHMFWSDNGVVSLLRGVNDDAIGKVSELKDNGTLISACTEWTQSVRGWLEERGSSILAKADTSRQLADTLLAIDDAFDYDEWEADCGNALQQSPLFVFEIFKPFIKDRAGVVACECIERAVNKVIEDIDGAWSDIEVNIHAGKRIWAVVSGQSVGSSIIAEHYKNIEDASKKSESVAIARILSSNREVSSVMGAFDKSLKAAIEDVEVLTKRIPAVTKDFVESVRSQLPRVLNTLKEQLQTIPVDSKDQVKKEVSSDYHLVRTLFVAWLSTAFGNADCVRTAFFFSEPDTSSKDDFDAHSEFQKTSRYLSAAAYGTWAKRLLLELRGRLFSELSESNKLHVRMGWSANKETETPSKTNQEDDEPQYPTTASTPMTNFLLDVCNSTNKAGGFALPFEAIDHLRREIIVTVITTYKKALMSGVKGNDDFGERASPRRGTTKFSETVSMQMLFDIQVVQELFTVPSTEAQSWVSDQSDLRDLESAVQTMVDPITLRSCRDSLTAAVSSYAARTSVLLGLIGRSVTGDEMRLKNPHIMASRNTSSNLVMLAQTVPRFTYLPAPMPSTYSIAVAGPTLNAKATAGMLRTQATSSTSTSTLRKKDQESSVADYASKVTESVGRFGRGFFESFTRKVT
ncbi:Conserved oligomeric Golgi complex subunit 1 [Gracilariopsis chorda]|uniref:Conserved oligomeric Golgi complex subunit 1 n=1 Tax=Gracilariopsis chorda TaxID=448386 RepID=A0A2V3IFB7_9FLOR|nr:Conserved oligomeric Golgi complex subunit 1 [Gracilariopsis chorda]|eukprot:PXF40767.1 Conserved oligomeric Golgi complex subunit 1 [Gracilariopsis chorda]